MAKSQTDLLVAGLLKAGFEELPSATRKARTFRAPIGTEMFDKQLLAFVGKAASLRVGRIYTNSYPPHPSLKAKWIKMGEGA